ncbi:Asp-tRNA(Asn)/Glu-tRNA(Gln) amidotransferase GatCAB subunit B [Candidatus Pacearchaeota archaeon CG10_big_fil_rev_8_21_14_0_10_30_48]|nr:MAG: Asp-tRNA(Asn)/Glu-tRNA(Gln) amidotransferase GatCAB subunit B [Candidatus Pacearchaeota archaeon CG10_big_fil_rev_8_21_14_0_10_30_48]
MTKIGLEIHGYLDTKEKLFCSCLNSQNERKNSLICPICTGQPGSKPNLPNVEALKKSVQIALMLNTKINTIENKKKLIWQRKHYSWPDLPKGYQTTLSGTYAVPIGENGKFLGIRIRELHLEEDPASWDPKTGCIDYNRSGSPLIEIVTEPDFTSSEEVTNWLKRLIITLSYIKAINKQAGIKADVNVNIEGVSERTEIKNVHSIKDIAKVIEFELIRQKKERPKKMETRRWNPQKEKTEPMRSKESHADYRFISDPDLTIISLKEKDVNKIKSNLPESPEIKLKKLITQHKIPKEHAETLSKNLELVEFFESVITKIKPEFALPWINVELLRVLNYNKKTLDEVAIEINHFIELLQLIQQGKLTELKGKQILNKFIPKSFSPKSELKGSERITNEKELSKLIEEVIKKNSKAVQDYKAGEKNSFNYLMGEIMKSSNRRADFKIASDILKELLKK